MVRQYRIDRYSGMEILVCEVFHRHNLTVAEGEALYSWLAVNPGKKFIDFIEAASDYFADTSNYDENGELVNPFFGITAIPATYDSVPSVILRGPVVKNRIVSLQVDFVEGVSSLQIEDEVHRFFGVMRSSHWRDMVSHQVTRYGSLFDSDNDS